MQTKWQDLKVSDADGSSCGRLGNVVAEDDGTMTKGMVFNDDGSLSEWTGYFIARQGEEFSWDTPHGETDWTGLKDAVDEMRE